MHNTVTGVSLVTHSDARFVIDAPHQPYYKILTEVSIVMFQFIHYESKGYFIAGSMLSRVNLNYPAFDLVPRSDQFRLLFHDYLSGTQTKKNRR